jgi:hypothetical protein
LVIYFHLKQINNNKSLILIQIKVLYYFNNLKINKINNKIKLIKILVLVMIFILLSLFKLKEVNIKILIHLFQINYHYLKLFKKLINLKKIIKLKYFIIKIKDFFKIINRED